MKLLLTDFYHQATERFKTSLKRAEIDLTHVNITYDGWLPEGVHNPISYYLGYFDAPEKPLHYNQLEVPDFWEIKNSDGARAEILDGETLKGYVIYQPDTARLIREVEWLDLAGNRILTERYNRQGQRFAQSLFDADGKEMKTLYFNAAGEKVLTVDGPSKAVILEIPGKTPQVFENFTAFTCHYLRDFGLERWDEVLFNSLSTPFFVSNALSELPGTLYFQEPIRDAIPGNMQTILSGKTPAKRILFENAKELAKAQKLVTNPGVSMGYLGAIEHFTRENQFRKRALTLTRSDQILYDEGLAVAMASFQMTWTIAAPSEISDKLRNFALNHANVTVLEAYPLGDFDKLLAENDIYLDLNQGKDTQNAVQRAYLEGLLVVGDMKTAKNGPYEILLENEKEITDVLKAANKQRSLDFLRSKKGKQASPSDYQEAFQ
ncbi:MAG: hypothetical protein LBI43_02815 [Streptococcaceae bacterium]|jgi:accessory Sec system glycosyltransferase GtfB|nr:hypothetical protein [Streptococcaceae bacterium]